MELPSVATFLLFYFILMNLIGFLVMGIDKLKAKKRGFRIPEATLFLIAFIGGSIGSILGMYLFRHKTRHRSFIIGMPVILAVQIIIALVIIFGPFVDVVTI
ncbi:MAG: DUF1294 domain-containing protein [Lachnospiraceae bacterium]|nr:DUF1294 domain-containing protein [Lachnospiraceae bacterium]